MPRPHPTPTSLFQAHLRHGNPTSNRPISPSSVSGCYADEINKALSRCLPPREQRQAISICQVEKEVWYSVVGEVRAGGEGGVVLCGGRGQGRWRRRCGTLWWEWSGQVKKEVWYSVVGEVEKEVWYSVVGEVRAGGEGSVVLCGGRGHGRWRRRCGSLWWERSGQVEKELVPLPGPLTQRQNVPLIPSTGVCAKRYAQSTLSATGRLPGARKDPAAAVPVHSNLTPSP
ncbi:hypothetical protein P4O66_016722 [Electrophorus voltai]|uniref:Uncharacterized protein n=1 Tax=Electrophorus voltai TaxID=2609070 RepID=A0AAD8YYQ2_9TELE|nr:hypothetical protein P4O66_016722 [Electrophorus voltai]